VFSTFTTFSGVGRAGLKQRSRRLLLCWLAASIALHLTVLVVLPGFVEEREPLTAQVLNVVLLPLDTPPAVTLESPPPPPASDHRPSSRTRQGASRTEKQSHAPSKPEAQDRLQARAPPALSDPQPIAKPPSETPSVPPSETHGAAETKSEAPPPRDIPKIAPPAFNAAYLRNPAPRYPLMARRRGEQGTVTLRVLVTRDGFPARVSVERTSGSGQLDSAALETVKTWRFAPARQGSEPIDAWVLVPVVFRLEGTS
jgi:protein TonB